MDTTGSEEKKRDSIFWTGLVLVLLWVWHLPYLSQFPLRSTAGTEMLSAEAAGARGWLKEDVGLEGMAQEEIQSGLVAAYRRAFMTSLLLIVAGVGSGVLVLRRSRWGRFLAIGVSLYVLLSRAPGLLAMGNPLGVQFAKFRMSLAPHPFRVIHGDILTLLILLLALANLLRPSVARRFGCILHSEP